jgi:hypothetical protein
MNDDTSQRRWLPRGARILVAAIVLLTAACSGSSPPGGSGRSTATGRPAASARSGSSPAMRRPAAQKQLAYSECMRSHGVPGVPTSFPSPVLGKPPGKLSAKPAAANGPGPGSPRWQAAQQACRSLMPTPVEVPG